MISKSETYAHAVIGFIVCNLIEDGLVISSLFPAKEGIYRFNYDKLVLTLKILYAATLNYIISMICFIVYAFKYDYTHFDMVFLIINVIIGVFAYCFLIASIRALLGKSKRVKEIQELFAARSKINV